MGIDKSLTDDFPSIVIGGTRYQYGRDTRFGSYLVENADYAKDYWWFKTREDMLAFLANLPESADRNWIRKRYPDWSEVTDAQRELYMRERDAHWRRLLAEKREQGTDGRFNVLTFDEFGYYEAFPDPSRAHWSVCDDMVVRVEEHEARGGGKEFLIELHSEPKLGRGGKESFVIAPEQALKLASHLIRAADDVGRNTEVRSGKR